jgi:hypothetical protein
VVLVLSLELIELAGQNGVGGEQFPQSDERAHDIDTHRNGARGVDDVGGLDRAVLGERPRELAAATAARL